MPHAIELGRPRELSKVVVGALHLILNYTLIPPQ
jgi:hypothetical protein